MNKAPPPAELTDLTRPLGARPLHDADYRLMVDAVTDYAIFLLDMNGVIRSWNAGAEKMKQYAAEEIIGRHFSIFYPQELIDRKWPQFELEEAVRQGRFEDEGWRVRKDGTRFWANIIITHLVGPAGDERGFSKITRDLTERRRAEEMMRHSEERFRLLVESVKDYAIFMLDPSGHVVSWNPGAEKSKGYKASEIIGRHFSTFYPEELAHSGAPAHELEVALKEGRFEDEGWRIRKDGTRFWAGVVLTAIFDEGGRHRGFAKVTRDLTQSRKVTALEDEGRRVTTFLAMLGHELRNPLAPVVNAVSLMRRETIESQTLRAARDVIDRQVAQMTRLVDDLLDVSRITSGKVRLDQKPVRLQDVLGPSCEAVEPIVQARSHRLQVVVDKADCWVCGDRARLVQIVTNLLTNAAKFTPDHGRLDLELKAVGESVEIRVRDDGPGIPLRLQSEIFNLFVQGEPDSSRSNGGLGLGLPLTRQLVCLHGGEVEVFSSGEPGSGSEFVVRLPCIKAPSEAIRTRLPGGRRRILVVDDNRDSADTMSLLMEASGYEARAVYDGPSALSAIAADPPDVVLLDIGLPGLSGLEVARRIEAELVDPPHLIAISGYGQERDRAASLKAGFHTHLAKPVDFVQLSHVLRQLLAGT